VHRQDIINHSLRELKQQADLRLKSEQGIIYRKHKEQLDVEHVFANIKHNKNFKQFMFKRLVKGDINTQITCFSTQPD
jgi:hypothetical protein